jgi:4-aminobutyrate aminotransferase-like enzyme
MNTTKVQKTVKIQEEKHLEQYQQQQEQEIMNTQSNQMNEIHVTVKNLREIGQVMGNELDDQTRLLDDVEQQTDHVQNYLAETMNRMKTFINSNSDIKQQISIIILIIVLFIVMVMLVFY